MSNTTVPISFEFFPPKTTAGIEKLVATACKLAEHKPAYVSVTFGAGGSSCSKTFDTVRLLQQHLDCEVVPHLSCINLERDDIIRRLDRYQKHGIKRIVALRGDRASGSGIAQGDLKFGSDLVTLIRQHCGNEMQISVAAYPESHPESQDLYHDIQHFKHKVQQGADNAITQYFYNLDAYANFCQQCTQQTIDIPIIPGIMPIYSLENLQRFSNLCGAEIPRWLQQSLVAYQNDIDSLRELGIEVVARLCQQLIAAGAPGLHFYSLNQANVCDKILRTIRHTTCNMQASPA